MEQEEEEENRTSNCSYVHRRRRIRMNGCFSAHRSRSCVLEEDRDASVRSPRSDWCCTKDRHDFEPTDNTTDRNPSSPSTPNSFVQLQRRHHRPTTNSTRTTTFSPWATADSPDADDCDCNDEEYSRRRASLSDKALDFALIVAERKRRRNYSFRETSFSQRLRTGSSIVSLAKRRIVGRSPYSIGVSEAKRFSRGIFADG